MLSQQTSAGNDLGHCNLNLKCFDQVISSEANEEIA